MKVGLYRRLNEIIKNFPYKYRLFIYRCLGMSVGEHSLISMGLRLDNPSRITIGNHCFLNHDIGLLTGTGDATITIGDHVSIGMDSVILCPTHKIGRPEQRAGKNIYKPVRIESGCWIGARVTVLPGVTIRQGAVIGAGSIVAHDCEANCVYAGSPAKFIRYADADFDPSEYM